ncbi:unnamed protein product [Ectocarpus sp. CCAP 1310/34]|nr:unnamed protein product [Ectocarpus sp. CCAP 1310/34]
MLCNRQVMTRLMYHLLILALCRRIVVRGFGLLPPLLLSQSRGGVTPRSSCRPRDRVIMTGAFWEGIVQGVGMKTPTPPTAKEKGPVLICPAQLSVPGDYRQMVTELKKRGFPAYCADLTRFGWITGLLPSALSPEYVKGELTPANTLKFYYEAIDRALEEIKERHPGQGMHVIGHSIGGWVARAWLAEGCADADRENVLSLTTLGTPNTGPPEDAGLWAAVDQTRGLLKYINARFPGAHVEGVRYTSVAGTALEGKLPGSVEEMLAYVSYLPLCGDGGSRGDGIIPLDVAVLEGSTVVELPSSKHSGFIPFPGDAIDLGEDFLWYGSSSLMDSWVGNLDAAEQNRRGTRRQAARRKSGGKQW